MIDDAFSPRFILLYVFVLSAVFPHFRGRIRHRFTRQLTDHSTIPYAGSLRYHLGLVTPNADTCKIFIDGEPYYWKDGEDVLFDETYIHYAENKSDITRLILFCDVERPMKISSMTRFNRFMANTLVRASKTQNVEGEPVGVLNKIFGYAYRVRLVGKALKAKSRFAYYAVKYALIGGLLYWIFLS